jgi:beta-glucosidase
MAVVDEAVRRVLRVKFATGLFEHPYAEGLEVTAAVAEHRPLVRKAAEESFVLLQNDKLASGAPLLPLSLATFKRVALIGPLADDAEEMVGAWSGAPKSFSDIITLRQALEERTQQVGGDSCSTPREPKSTIASQAGFPEAIEPPQGADVAILALGESKHHERRGQARAPVSNLPGNQQQLLEAVAATGKPVVLLIFSGRPLVLNWAAQHIPAIMEVWFPGTEAGHAIADILYGDVSPSGKLPMSFPRAVGQEPLYYNQPPNRTSAHGDRPLQAANWRLALSSPATSIFPTARSFPSVTGFPTPASPIGTSRSSKPSIPLPQALANRSTPLLEATATVTNTGEAHGHRGGPVLRAQSGRQHRTASAKPQGIRASHSGSRANRSRSAFRWASTNSPSSTWRAPNHRSDPLHGLDRGQFAGQPGSLFFGGLSRKQKPQRANSAGECELNRSGSGGGAARNN